MADNGKPRKSSSFAKAGVGAPSSPAKPVAVLGKAKAAQAKPAPATTAFVPVAAKAKPGSAVAVSPPLASKAPAVSKPAIKVPEVAVPPVPQITAPIEKLAIDATPPLQAALAEPSLPIAAPVVAGLMDAASKASEAPSAQADTKDSAVAPQQPSQNLEAESEPTPTVSSTKDSIMDMSANISSFQTAMGEAQTKAQKALEKSQAVFGEVSEFTKGNVEAVIASGKILANGMQDLGSSLVAEGRTSFESMTADMKELAAAKSPTDFLKVQSEMARKNFDTIVAQSSKNTEAFLKLMSDVYAPITGRVSLAVEKVRQSAPASVAA